MQKEENFIVATIKKWHTKIFYEKIRHYKGNWYLINKPEDLNDDFLYKINPKYIFFPHWSSIVPNTIIKRFECVCFHETDLPYGRGGSPIQNLIIRGHKETFITALKMTEEIDAGPIYLKKRFCLNGLAEEIYLRSAYIIAEMIKEITENDIKPQQQKGEAIVFKRRKPEESNIENVTGNLIKMFDFIRMLDADSYPKAFFEINGYRFEFSRPALRTNEIISDVKITKIRRGKE